MQFALRSLWLQTIAPITVVPGLGYHRSSYTPCGAKVTIQVVEALLKVRAGGHILMIRLNRSSRVEYPATSTELPLTKTCTSPTSTSELRTENAIPR
jgi:hypothetical protein